MWVKLLIHVVDLNPHSERGPCMLSEHDIVLNVKYILSLYVTGWQRNGNTDSLERQEDIGHFVTDDLGTTWSPFVHLVIITDTNSNLVSKVQGLRKKVLESLSHNATIW